MNNLYPHEMRHRLRANIGTVRACLGASILCGVLSYSLSALAQIDSEQLVNAACTVAAQNAADWDTIVECPAAPTTFARGPYFLGTTSIPCAAGTSGQIYYTGTVPQYCNGTFFNGFAPPYSGASLSSLTGATAANTINNLNNALTWTWNTLTTQNALSLTSLLLTTGTIMTTTATNTSFSGAALNVSTASIGTASAISATQAGTSNTGYAAEFTNASTTGYGVYSAGTSPNYFGGSITVPVAKNYQINGNVVLSLPFSSDTTSIEVGIGALASQSVINLDNTAVGNNALYTALGSSSTSNDAVGYEAVYIGTSSTSYTDAMGYNAFYDSGPPSTVVLGALVASQESAFNGTGLTVLGYEAAYSPEPVNVSYVVALGAQANYSGIASDTVSVGYQASYSSSTSDLATAVGYQALYSMLSATNTNTALGYQAGYYITTSGRNLAVGYQSMYGVSGTPLTTSAAYNTAVGTQALYTIQGTASNNTAAGYQALYSNSTGSYNTGIGYQALYSNATSSDCTAIGASALYSATSCPNDAFGYQAGYYITSGVNNVAMGYQSMYGLNGTPLTGSNNTAVGYQALYSLQGAASGNTALGYQAGYAGTAITTGSNNTFVGYQAQSNGATYTNGTALGNGAILTASNTIVLGNSAISKIYAKVNSITGISDRRHKKDITDLPDTLGRNLVMKLKPISYRFNNGDETLRYGFIAQDLETALPEELQHVVETSSPEHGIALLERQNDKDRTYRVAYGELTAPIVKTIQEQRSDIDDIQTTLKSINGPADHNPLEDNLLDDTQSLTNKLQGEGIKIFIPSLITSICGAFFGFLFIHRKMI